MNFDFFVFLKTFIFVSVFTYVAIIFGYGWLRLVVFPPKKPKKGHKKGRKKQTTPCKPMEYSPKYEIKDVFQEDVV